MEYTAKPVFIVGAPRSGTHLMRFCISKHSSIHIAPETAFFYKIWGGRRTWKKYIFGNSWFVTESLKKMIFESGDPSMDDLKPHYVKLKDSLYEVDKLDCAFKVFLSETANIHGKKMFGEKTPNHLHFISSIYRLFPDAKVICMTRDYKSVCASFMKSGHLSEKFSNAYAQVSIAQRAVFKLDDRVMVVKYTDLVNDSETTLRGVCEYMQVCFEDEMLYPGMIDSSFREEVMERNNLIGIKPSLENRWTAVLSAEQLGFLELAMSGKMILSIVRYPKLAVKCYLKKIRLSLTFLKSQSGFAKF